MSWSGYIDSLKGSEHVEKAAIIGLDGSTWASSEGLVVSPQEANDLVRGFGDSGHLQAKGIILSGVKYMYILSDDKQIQGKKGPGGISLARSGKCVIVGVYKEGMQPGNCRKAVENMCDYLISNGY